MLMQVDPIYGCYKGILKNLEERGITEIPRVIYMSPKGRTFTQERAVQLSGEPDVPIIILSGPVMSQILDSADEAITLSQGVSEIYRSIWIFRIPRMAFRRNRRALSFGTGDKRLVMSSSVSADRICSFLSRRVVTI